MKILVTGGTGFLGSRLIEELLRKQHQVVLLSRQSISEVAPHGSPCRIVKWPVESPAEEAALLDCDALIHLAGESIAKGRWTKKRKEQLRSSRAGFTSQILDLLRQSSKLHTVLSGSAIGFYGDRKSEVLTEASPQGEGFLAEVCRDWEAAALGFKRPGLRTVLLRTGIVLERHEGFLKEMEPLFKLWAGGPVGSGRQSMSWIHIRDWVRATVHCLENSAIEGPVNIVGPEPVTNAAFSAVYGEIFGQPMQLRAPALALKTFMGEMASLALDSQNVRPEKLLNSGFRFLFQHLSDALADLYDLKEQKGEVYDYFTMRTWLPASIEEVFLFFGNEKNLEIITPPNWHFRVIQKSTSEILPGTLIDHQLKLHGVPIKWQSKIEKWQPPRLFVDTQVRGPYSHWYHVHEFESLGDGTLMVDRIHYRLPLGKAGRLFGLKLVQNDLKYVFHYRKKVISENFAASI